MVGRVTRGVVIQECKTSTCFDCAYLLIAGPEAGSRNRIALAAGRHFSGIDGEDSVDS